MILRLFNALLVTVIAFIILSVVVALLGSLNLPIASTIAGIISPFVWAISILLGVISFFGGFPANWNLIK